MRTRLSPPVLVAITLPVLLALAVAAVGIAGRLGAGEPAAATVEAGPLALAPVDAPDATGPDCTALLAALPDALDGPLPTRPLADPVQPGARAWAAAPRPVVLRCGLPRPVELTATSALLEVNGVRWLELDDGVPNPTVITYVAVDRPVYAVLTVPASAGSGPLQQVSDVVRETLAATTVQVR